MRELDKKDRKLLYEVDLNARAGTSELGKRIGLSQEGAFYRLQRLEKRGIIAKYMILLNFAKLGYTGFGIYARFQNVTKEEKAKVIEELKVHHHIYWLWGVGGKIDVAFALMAKNVIHFNEMFTEIASKYVQVLKDLTVSIRVELVQFPREYLIKKETHPGKSPRFGGFIESEQLKKVDELLLKEIANNARLSVLELAKRVQKPASTVGGRLKQLETKGIIQGYSAQIRCQEFGYQSYQLFIKAHNLTKQNKRRLLAYCQAHANIIFYIETVGEWNFELIYEIESQKQLQDLIIELRTKFSDLIKDVESIVVFDHYVKYNQYPL